MKKYQHIFFDLDRTLWDTDTNASEALLEIFDRFQLQSVFNVFPEFYRSFLKYNDLLWDEFVEGRIQKELLRVRRFELALADYGKKDKILASQLNENFLNINPYKSRLIPGANEVLDYLTGKGYHLYILTNGFTGIQETKIKSSGLNTYFKKIFTCENTFSRKPQKSFFEYAITSIHAHKKQSIMIGDDLKADIIGARNSGIDQIYFNSVRNPHQEKVTFEIAELREIMSIL